jgi:hypothetical protein
MNRKLILAAVALAGTLAAGASQAHSNDVRWSVTVGSPGVGVAVGLPAPVLLPRPVVVAPPVVVHRRQVAPVYWDADRDGIPNRYDRVYNPRWDRDGDGVPNRYDRHDNRWRHHHHHGHGYGYGR